MFFANGKAEVIESAFTVPSKVMEIQAGVVLTEGPGRQIKGEPVKLKNRINLSEY